MNRIKLIFVIVGLLGLIACEDGASIKINNQTNHNVYAIIEGNELTVAGGQSQKVGVDTHRKVFLFDDGKTNKTIQIVGETFRIWDDYEETYLSETDLKVYPGKTYNVYCSPNSASVKVVNNSESPIETLNYRKNKLYNPGDWFNVTFEPPLEKGDFAYYHLVPQTQENRFFYNFSLVSNNETIYSIGNEFDGVELFMDQQHLIVIEEEE